MKAAFTHLDRQTFMLLDYCCRCCGVTLIKRHGPFFLKTTPSDTWVVLQNLLMCMVCFYSLYYIVVSLCIGLFRVHEINSLLTPFDYTTQPSWQNPKYLGGLVFAWIVEEWVWDYAITVTLLHVGMTVAVMSDFPSAEHWWIALGSGLVMMIFGGQLLAYKLFRNNFVYPAELQNF
ncbi:putative transmembrane protein 244 isoform X2 [Xiphophorus hellerii]|uniref:putative transmembrane protein 244 isoform X2 n=1 Tax=Xiphophorus hellerii TaxID=8084 RepID=UPI0013B40B80|nr:transmembrane protein 244 isoform X2 [Xiphophorus hellerii]